MEESGFSLHPDNLDIGSFFMGERTVRNVLVTHHPTLQAPDVYWEQAYGWGSFSTFVYQPGQFLIQIAIDSENLEPNDYRGHLVFEQYGDLVRLPITFNVRLEPQPVSPAIPIPQPMPQPAPIQAPQPVNQEGCLAQLVGWALIFALSGGLIYGGVKGYNWIAQTFFGQTPTETTTPIVTAARPTQTKTTQIFLTRTPSQTIPPTASPSLTKTKTPTPSPTQTRTFTPTSTRTPTQTLTPKPTSTSTQTYTPQPASTSTPTNTPAPSSVECPGSLYTRLDVGWKAVVTVPNDNPTVIYNLRAQPNINSNIIGGVAKDYVVHIDTGPVCNNGFTWWKISVIKPTSNIGWMAEEVDGFYRLTPYHWIH